MSEVPADRTKALSDLSAMSERFEAICEAASVPADPAITSFVTRLHRETLAIAAEFTKSAEASEERCRTQDALARSLQNQNEALSAQIHLLTPLLPRLSPALRTHRRVSSRDAVEDIKRLQEARKATLEAWEVDLKEFLSFVHWRGAAFPLAHPFCAAIEAAEVRPCLDFGAAAASAAILAAIRAEGGVALEPLRVAEGPPVACALCPELPAAFKLSWSGSQEMFVCGLVRNRVAAVCEFYHHIGFLRSHRASTAGAQHKEIFCKLQELRFAIALARLGEREAEGESGEDARATL